MKRTGRRVSHHRNHICQTYDGNNRERYSALLLGLMMNPQLGQGAVNAEYRAFVHHVSSILTL